MGWCEFSSQSVEGENVLTWINVLLWNLESYEVQVEACLSALGYSRQDDQPEAGLVCTEKSPRRRVRGGSTVFGRDRHSCRDWGEYVRLYWRGLCLCDASCLGS